MSDDVWIIFALNYSLQSILLVILGTGTSAADLFLSVLFIQCTLQIDCLIKTFQPLQNLNEKNRHLTDTTEILRKIHETHLKLRNFVDETNRSYSIIILSQLLSSTLLICIPIYLFITSTTVSGMTIFIELVEISQLVVYCFPGQYLTNKFQELHDNMLQVCWFEFTNSERLSYITILRNMQHPVVVRSNFNELSFVAFRNVKDKNSDSIFKPSLIFFFILQILHKAFSFYAILNTITT